MKYLLVFVLFVLPISGWSQKIEITNLKEINTSKDDLAPIVFIANEMEYLGFSSKRKNKQFALFKSPIKNIDNQVFIALGTVEVFERNFSVIMGYSYPCFSKTGDQIFFTRTSRKENRRTILYRKKEGGKWGDFRTLPMSHCADKCELAYPCLSEDGEDLYFASNMPGGFGGWDLYVSYLEDGYWGPPINLGPTVNSEGDEVTPFISDQKELFFSSNRLGGYGGFDIYQSTLINGFWGNASNIGTEINSSANELDFINYKTKNAGFFSSDRIGGLGGYDIYHWNN
jgi:hypothetical protein